MLNFVEMYNIICYCTILYIHLLQQTNKVPQDMKTEQTNLISFKTLLQGHNIENQNWETYSIDYSEDEYILIDTDKQEVVEVVGIKELTLNQEQRAIELVNEWRKENEPREYTEAEIWENYKEEMLVTSDWHA